MFDPARNCIYCEGRRGDSQFSKEHIWPAALGGDACPEIFRTFQVCRRCNSLAGQWADGAFLKSWFLQNEAGVNSLLYMNPDQPGVAPLAYMGFDEEIVTADDEICERWIGPAGAHIYHIHLRDEERWHSFAGGGFLRWKRTAPGPRQLCL